MSKIATFLFQQYYLTSFDKLWEFTFKSSLFEGKQMLRNLLYIKITLHGESDFTPLIHTNATWIV